MHTRAVTSIGTYIMLMLTLMLLYFSDFFKHLKHLNVFDPADFLWYFIVPEPVFFFQHQLKSHVAYKSCNDSSLSYHSKSFSKGEKVYFNQNVECLIQGRQCKRLVAQCQQPCNYMLLRCQKLIADDCQYRNTNEVKMFMPFKPKHNIFQTSIFFIYG